MCIRDRWQAEPFQAFDFNLFNAQKYAAAVRERDAAEDISRVLYPNCLLYTSLPRGSKIKEEEKRRADAARHTTEQRK